MTKIVKLGDVADVTMGQAPPGDSYNDRREGVPLIAGAGDFRGDGIAASKYTTRPGKMSAAGDIVLSIRASIGAKVWAHGEYCLGRGVAALRARPGLEPRFLWHWLTYAERELAAKGRGATFLQVNRSDISDMRLPLPPSEEQRRIAAILDQADAIRTKRRQLLAHLDGLTAAVFHELFGSPMVSDRYPKKRLDSLARIVRGASPRPAGDSRYFGGPIPWLKISDITAEPSAVVRRIREGVTEAGRDRSVLLPPRTLVLTNSATVGIPKIIEPATCIHDGFLAFLDLHKSVDQTWLWAALAVSRPRLVALAPEGTQKNLNGPIVKAVELSVPPFELQQGFARQVEAFDAQRAAVERALAADDELFASLQSRAFRGEL